MDAPKPAITTVCGEEALDIVLGGSLKLPEVARQPGSSLSECGCPHWAGEALQAWEGCVLNTPGEDTPTYCQYLQTCF